MSNAQALHRFGSLECNEEVLREFVGKDVSKRAILAIHAQIRYAPYLLKGEQEIEKNKQYQSLTIPKEIIYSEIEGLSKELREKLTKHQPNTIAQAALIPGMTPAALSLLILKIRMDEKKRKNKVI